MASSGAARPESPASIQHRRYSSHVMQSRQPVRQVSRPAGHAYMVQMQAGGEDPCQPPAQQLLPERYGFNTEGSWLLRRRG